MLHMDARFEDHHKLLVLKKMFEGFLSYMGVAAILAMWPVNFHSPFH